MILELAMYVVLALIGIVMWVRIELLHRRIDLINRRIDNLIGRRANVEQPAAKEHA